MATATIGAEQNVLDGILPDFSFSFDRENNPNARILLQSIRSSGYTLETAIGDLIDNCLDANASVIAVGLDKVGNEWVITVADNGLGMDSATLDQMLRLGSETEHDESDLGLYGLGSTTASLGLGRRQHVLTTDGSVLLSGATDLDKILEVGKFVKHMGRATVAEVELFGTCYARWGVDIPQTGTVVQISKGDNVGREKLRPAIDAVKRYIGRTYRYFIWAGKRFCVNGEDVTAIDPLLRNDPRTQVLLEETFEYVFPKSHPRAGQTEQISCFVVSLPDHGGIDENKAAGFTSDNSGFYVLRNRREIVPSTTLDLYIRHPEFNRFRAELQFPATMDRDLGVTFLKSAWDIKMSQSLNDRIYQVVGPFMRQARSMYKKARKAVEDNVSHEAAEKQIGQRAPFLRSPRTKAEKHNGAEAKGGRSPKEPVQTNRTRTPGDNTQSSTASRVRFETKPMGLTAPFYEATLEGRRVLVTYNSDHPFYARFLLENRDEQSMVNAVDYLVFSLASAELMARDESTYLFIERMREDMSFNLRQLLTT